MTPLLYVARDRAFGRTLILLGLFTRPWRSSPPERWRSLFHGSLSHTVLADPEHGEPGGALLLHLPVPLGNGPAYQSGSHDHEAPRDPTKELAR